MGSKNNKATSLLDAYENENPLVEKKFSKEDIAVIIGDDKLLIGLIRASKSAKRSPKEVLRRALRHYLKEHGFL